MCCKYVDTFCVKHWATQSQDTVQNTNYNTVSMFGISTLRKYQLCHIIDIPWLLQTNQADITWLASQLPLFSRCYPDYSQLSQALLFIQSGWLLSCCVECRSPSIIQWILCFQRQIRFVLLFVLLKIISYFHCCYLQRFGTKCRFTLQTNSEVLDGFDWPH